MPSALYRTCLFTLMLLMAFSPAWAEDDWGDDGDGDGFEEAADIKKTQSTRPWSIGGFARTRAGFWVERLSEDPLSTARQSLDLNFRYRDERFRVVAEIHGEYDLAYTLDEDQYDQATMDTYEWRILHGEQFGAVSLGQFELVLGRQIVAWGEGDVFSPLDVVNPRDLREPGLADLDDIRLAVLASKWTYFWKHARLEALVIHEAYFGERPSPRAEYSPLVQLFDTNPDAAALLGNVRLEYDQVQKRYAPKNWTTLLRFLHQGQGFDWGLYGGWLRDRQGVIQAPDLGGLAAGVLKLPLDHRRYWMAGHSGSLPMGDWLIKWETLAEIDKSFNTANLNGAIPEIGVEQATLLTGMLGVTWSGLDQTTIGFEATRGLFVDAPDDQLFPADATSLALRLSRTFLRETLRVDGAATTVGWRGQYGWLSRIEATYELTDALKLSLTYVHFGVGDDDEMGPFMGLVDHDQVLTKLRWSFTAF